MQRKQTHRVILIFLLYIISRGEPMILKKISICLLFLSVFLFCNSTKAIEDSNGYVGIQMYKFKKPRIAKEITIINVFPNSPAWNVGIRTADRILKVNDIDVSDKALDEVQKLISGKVNSNVKLTLKTRYGIKDFVVTRAAFNPNNNLSYPQWNDLYKYIKSHNIKGNIIESNAKFSIQSVLKIYLKFTDLNLDTPKTVVIEDEHAKLLNYIENGIYRFNNNYYEIKYNAKKQVLTYTRKSNFSINILRTVVFNTLNFENIQEHKLEIVTNIDNKVSMPKILSQKELLDVNNLHEILKESGIHIHTLKDAQFKNIILNELKNTNEELNIYKNPSLINHDKKNYWLYKNAIVNLETGDILKPTDKDKNIIVVNSKNTISLDVDRGMHAPKLYIPEITYNEFVEQNKGIELIQEFAPTSKTIPSLIAKTLFVNTLRTYDNKVEAFLVLGTALMSPFVDVIYDKTMGFPINFMYGEAASGKSNLLQTIAYILGFDT